jgi:hypothetical protein
MPLFIYQMNLAWENMNIILGVRKTNSEYFYMNWGWGAGAGNGWFYSDMVSPNSLQLQ